ncbi:MAG: hypothetical protein KAY24_08385 [Candidatus Eisenbacteria sp.]|nr:hypothetical protein [Candidatus Eisenbacteria bacterium]
MRFIHQIPIILLAMAAGCAASIKDQSAVNYVGGDFAPDVLREGGMAMLPVVAGAGQEGYRRPLAECLTGECQLAMGTGRFAGWQETMEILNEEDLSDSYQMMIATYRETAILRKETVSRLGEALSVRFLLFCSLEQFHSQTSTTYSIFTGFNTVRKSGVTAFCQVWDAETGDVVWEGQAAAKSAGGELTYDKPYEEYARIAAKGLARELFQLAER